MRYGSTPDGFSYARGEQFAVEHSATTWVDITITLQRVLGGRYRTHGISRLDFERAA